MQSVRSRIWTRVAVSISYDDNDYTTGTSIKWRDGDANRKWCTRNNSQWLGKRTGRVKNLRTSGDHPDVSIIKIGLTEKSSENLRLAVTQPPEEDHLLTLVWKTLKKSNNMRVGTTCWEPYKGLKYDHTIKSYNRNPESVLENEMYYIVCNFKELTDHQIPARRLDIRIITMKKLSYPVDFANLAEHWKKAERSTNNWTFPES